MTLSLWFLLAGGTVSGLVVLLVRSSPGARFIKRQRWRRRLKHGEIGTQLTAIRELASSGDPDAVGLLITALSVPAGAVRVEAARSLGAIGSSAATVALESLLRDGDVDVRSAAVAALGDIEDPEAAGVLMEVLRREQSTTVRMVAEEALAKIELEPRKAEEDIARFIAALRHDDGAYRKVAVDTLLRLKPPEALEPLVDALVDTDIRPRIGAALDEIDPDWRALPYVHDKAKHWHDVLHRGHADTAGIREALRVIERT